MLDKAILELIEKIKTQPLTAKEQETVLDVIELLDQGKVRVAEQKNGAWTVNAWVKSAILLYFQIQKLAVIKSGDLQFFDKIPLKKWTGDEGVRVVPHALARRGSFIEKGAILMPSYVNIGAYVGSGSMIDTWATVGSCAQVGRNVHLSGGVGLGGVLEPVQASPVIIEDDAFIGSRSIIVEGVRVEKGAVIGAGVTLTASTPILDVSGSRTIEMKGVVPANSVVISGTRPKEFPSGLYHTQCALIIGKRKESTNAKTSLNDALREFEVSV